MTAVSLSENPLRNLDSCRYLYIMSLFINKKMPIGIPFSTNEFGEPAYYLKTLLSSSLLLFNIGYYCSAFIQIYSKILLFLDDDWSGRCMTSCGNSGTGETPKATRGEAAGNIHTI